VDQRLDPGVLLAKRSDQSPGHGDHTREDGAVNNLQSTPSLISLSDGEDYSRRVLTVTNQDDN